MIMRCLSSTWDGYNITDPSGNVIHIGELSIGTSPVNNDTDGYNITDSKELEDYTYTIHRISGNWQYTSHSSPLLWDTDGDGLSDWEERNPGEEGYITNARATDSDSDGLMDSQETYTRTFTIEKRYVLDSQKTISLNARVNNSAVKSAYVRFGLSEFQAFATGLSAGLGVYTLYIALNTKIKMPGNFDLMNKIGLASTVVAIAGSGAQLGYLLGQSSQSQNGGS